MPSVESVSLFNVARGCTLCSLVLRHSAICLACARSLSPLSPFPLPFSLSQVPDPLKSTGPGHAVLIAQEVFDRFDEVPHSLSRSKSERERKREREREKERERERERERE